MSWSGGIDLLIDISIILEKKLSKKITEKQMVSLLADIAKLFEDKDCDLGEFYCDLEDGDPLKQAIEKINPDFKSVYD